MKWLSDLLCVGGIPFSRTLHRNEILQHTVYSTPCTGCEAVPVLKPELCRNKYFSSGRAKYTCMHAVVFNCTSKYSLYYASGHFGNGVARFCSTAEYILWLQGSNSKNGGGGDET